MSSWGPRQCDELAGQGGGDIRFRSSVSAESGDLPIDVSDDDRPASRDFSTHLDPFSICCASAAGRSCCGLAESLDDAGPWTGVVDEHRVKPGGARDHFGAFAVIVLPDCSALLATHHRGDFERPVPRVDWPYV